MKQSVTQNYVTLPPIDDKYISENVSRLQLRIQNSEAVFQRQKIHDEASRSDDEES